MTLILLTLPAVPKRDSQKAELDHNLEEVITYKIEGRSIFKIEI